MSYGNVIVTVRCEIQLVDIILFLLRQTEAVTDVSVATALLEMCMLEHDIDQYTVCLKKKHPRHF